MTKVAYNCCYGGFSISEKAVRRARELEPHSHLWKQIILFGEEYEDGSKSKYDYNSYHIHDIPRHNKTLITVIEELGEAANGAHAWLQIDDIHASCYWIHEYDGMERVETPDTIEWVTL